MLKITNIVIKCDFVQRGSEIRSTHWKLLGRSKEGISMGAGMSSTFESRIQVWSAEGCRLSVQVSGSMKWDDSEGDDERKRIGAAGSLIDHLPTREVVGVLPRNLDESKRIEEAWLGKDQRMSDHECLRNLRFGIVLIKSSPQHHVPHSTSCRNFII